MATIDKRPVEAKMTLSGGPPPVLHMKEAAGQTFVKGEFVVVNANGYVQEITADNPTSIYGVAAAPASNTTSDGEVEVPVFLATPDVLFAGNVLAAGLANKVLAQTDLGTAMAIQRDTTNNMVFLNASTTSGANVRVFVHKQAQGTAVGDTNGRVLFNFLSGYTQSLVG